MEKENLIMQYIAVWSWHIIAMIFLVGGFVIFFSGEGLGNNVMFVAFIFMWVVSEVLSLNRRSKLVSEELYENGEVEEIESPEGEEPEQEEDEQIGQTV